MLIQRRADLSFDIGTIRIVRPMLCFEHAVRAAMIGCPVTEEVIEGERAMCTVCDGHRHYTADDFFDIDGDAIMQKVRKIVQATGV